jgi:hypothetical protein
VDDNGLVLDDLQLGKFHVRGNSCAFVENSHLFRRQLVTELTGDESPEVLARLPPAHLSHPHTAVQQYKLDLRLPSPNLSLVLLNLHFLFSKRETIITIV